MELNEIISLIITFIVGGGLTTLITLPFIRRKAKNEADSSHMEVVQKIIDEYQDLYTQLKTSYEEREQLIKERLSILEKRYKLQQTEIKDNTKIILELRSEIAEIKKLKVSECSECKFMTGCEKYEYLNK
jgi:urate oxidase